MKQRRQKPCAYCSAAWRPPDPIVGPAAISPSGSIIRFQTTAKAARYVELNPDFTVLPGPDAPDG